MKTAAIIRMNNYASAMRKKNILAAQLAVCLLIFFSGILHFNSSALTEEKRTEIQNKLAILTPLERELVQELFNRFFFFDGFAYTLLGSKPMSEGRLLPTGKAWMGWDAWEKLSPHFRSQKFLIRKCVYDGYNFVLVANLKEVEKIYYQNRGYFDRAFGELMTLDRLITCIKDDGPLFQEMMHDHLLLGILFGYGARNAEIFVHNHPYSLEDERIIPFKYFSGSLHPIFYLFSGLLPINFVCDPTTEETKALKVRYKQERKEIIKKSKRDSLFLQMLAVLSE
jgi:hypothetical protein